MSGARLFARFFQSHSEKTASDRSVACIEPLEARTLLSIAWHSAATSPLIRAEGSKAVVNGKMYIVGGFAGQGLSVTKELDVYDPVANKWTRLADMPVPETHGATAVIGNVFYIAGFFFNDGVTASNLVYMYDTVSNTWTKEPSLPAGRGAAGAAILDNTLHVWGGLTGMTTSAADHWALDLSNPGAGWETLAPLPEALDHVGSLALNGELWSLGGFHNKDETNGNENDVYRYDPSTNQWSKNGVAQLPEGLGHIGPDTALAGNDIIIAGGQVNASFEDEITQVLEYDPAKNQWTTLTSLPAPRKSAFCGYADGELIVSCGNQPTSPYSSNATFVAAFDPGAVAQPVTVSGTVFNDSNGNGKLDGGEGGIAGVTVYSDQNNNGQDDSSEASAVTDANGNYTLTGVPGGATVIRQMLPAGDKQTFPGGGLGQHVTVGSSSLSGENFGDTVAAVSSTSVTGTVFNDANSNGSQGAGEAGLLGWRVFIDLNNDGILDNGELSTLTDGSGNFSFTNLTAGTYIFRAIRPAGWQQTTPANGFGQHVTVSAGKTVSIKFGERQGS